MKTYSSCCKYEQNLFWVIFFFLICFLKQVAALWTVPGTSLQMHLLIFPLFLPEGKTGSILFGLAEMSRGLEVFGLCFAFSGISYFI